MAPQSTEAAPGGTVLRGSRAAEHSPPQGRRTVKVSLDEIAVPGIAWPTVALFGTALGAWAAAAYCRVAYGAPWYATMPVSTVSTFALFTPMHDAAHRSVSRRVRWLNDMVGRICALFFLAPFPAFRYVHLQHHKHTNDPVKDPDYWSGEGPNILKPLRWATQELHYYIPYFSSARQQPVVEFAESLLTLLALLGVVAASVAQGWFSDVAVAWLVPVRLAVPVLAYTFDYIPHRPHEETRATNPYVATSKVDGILSTGYGELLSLPLLWQNYHNIHHLWPMVPFYRYSLIWFKHRDQLIAAGTPVVPMFDSTRPWM